MKIQSEYLQNYDKIPLQFVHKSVDNKIKTFRENQEMKLTNLSELKIEGLKNDMEQIRHKNKQRMMSPRSQNSSGDERLPKNFNPLSKNDDVESNSTMQ